MLEQLTVCSHAKVNLSLDVLGKRLIDGYHYVRSVMLPIDLSDQVTLSKAAGISVTMTPDLCCPPEANLAFRAAHLLRNSTGYSGGASIRIEKVIPVAAGLAGGSTNAAAVLTGLNRLWETGLSEQELIDLAIMLGSDVPFFVAERPARVESIGERLTPISVKHPLWMVLATPGVTKSTGDVYRLFDELQYVSRPATTALETALAEGDVLAVGASLGNVFEQVMLPRHPEISILKRSMVDLGAVGALMSGAGPTVFGIVENELAGRMLEVGLGSLGAKTSLVRTIGGAGDGP